MNCKDFKEIVDSYLSDELLTETNHEMMRHMEACADCRNVIEARREIRNRLKTAVMAAPEYHIDEEFDRRLLARLRHEAGSREYFQPFSFFGLKSLSTAAILLILGLIGIGVHSYLDSGESPPYLVSGFSENSLVNVASGDHQHCAIKYDLDEPPIPLAQADPQYRGLDDVIGAEIEKSFAGHKLVESHACTFKDVRFAHFVLSAPDDTISVLVAPTGKHMSDLKPKISEYASDAYQISNFDVEQNTVFVISARGKDRNRKAAETLSKPLEQHFGGRGGFRATLLTAFVKPQFHAVK